MSNKTYGQLCPLARSLDVLGDRWTLLIIRELLLGPKRFKNLLSALPAMGTNRLSERLNMLVENGVIQQVTPSAASSGSAYELTALGEQLRKPLLELSLWGLSVPIDERIDPATARADLIMLCLTAAVDPALVADLQEIYEFQVGSEIFHVSVDHGAVMPRSGPSPTPADLKIYCDMEILQGLVMGQIEPEQARLDGLVHLLHGDQETFKRVFKILHYNPQK